MTALRWLWCVLWTGHAWETRAETDEGREQKCLRCGTWRTEEVPE
jgi:hypothetical protein